jgi:hypothetical protein
VSCSPGLAPAGMVTVYSGPATLGAAAGPAAGSAAAGSAGAMSAGERQRGSRRLMAFASETDASSVLTLPQSAASWQLSCSAARAQ